jgi:hypothetical protein
MAKFCTNTLLKSFSREQKVANYCGNSHWQPLTDDLTRRLAHLGTLIAYDGLNWMICVSSGRSKVAENWSAQSHLQIL